MITIAVSVFFLVVLNLTTVLVARPVLHFGAPSEDLTAIELTPSDPANPPNVYFVILDRYAGEYKTPAGPIIIRRAGSALQAKVGNMEEQPLVARSETRFSDPWGSIFEFQVDGAGTVTGLIQQQGQLITAGTAFFLLIQVGNRGDQIHVPHGTR